MKSVPEQKTMKDELIFVGYTNGNQILYATEINGWEGSFYADTDNDCYIPLYMLKSHAHRLQSTSNMHVTLEKLKKAQKLDA